MKCLCAHPRHPGSRCPVTACGCGTYRPTTTALTEPTRLFLDCQMPCDADCEIAPVHCYWWHEPNHRSGYHDPARCDAAAAREAG